MTVDVDNYQFDFPDALEAFKFDEPNPESPYYHGVTQMKAVDLMVEFPDVHLYVEIKEYDDLCLLHEEGERYDSNEARKWLRNNLVRKYRDTFLYRWCEKKVTKPIYYICLLNFDTALLTYFKKELKRNIPTGGGNPKRWSRSLLPVDSLFVLNEKAWNRNTLISRWGTCTHL